MALQHLRSGTANKRPIPTVMSAGQLAINTNEGSPGLFFKDSNGDLVKVGPVHIGTSAPNSSPDSLAATALVTGTVYQILTVGNSDFTLVGASANTVGTVFTATGTTTGTGTVSGQQGNEKGEQWLDTTGSAFDLKIYDGTAWRSQAGEFVNVTGDTMTGAFGVVAGTASAPGVFFSGDTNTGLLAPAADSVAVTTGGTQRVVVDSSGNVFIGGTTAANADIALNADGSATFVGDPGSNGTTVGTKISSTGLIRVARSSDGPVFQSNKTDGSGYNVTINANGSATFAGDITCRNYVDITRAGDSAAFQVNKDGVGATAKINGNGSAEFAGGKFIISSGGTILSDNGGNPAGAAKVNINSNGTASFAGNVGIGTTSPSHLLTLKGTQSFQATNSTNNWLTYTYTDNTFRLNYNGAGADEVVIDSSGKVGIGVNPSARLTVKSPGASQTFISGKNSGATEIFKVVQNSGGGGELYLNGADGSNAISFSGSTGIIDIGWPGNSGSGTGAILQSGLCKVKANSSSNAIEVRDNSSANVVKASITGNGSATFAGQVVANVNNASGDDSALKAVQTNVNGYAIWAGSGPTAANRTFTVLPSGDVTCSGSLKIGGTAAANQIDEYEIGTWTPSVKSQVGETVTGGMTTAGTYVRIGDLLYLSATVAITGSGNAYNDGSLTWNSGPTASSIFLVGNVPFSMSESFAEIFTFGTGINASSRRPMFGTQVITGARQSGSTTITFFHVAGSNTETGGSMFLTVGDWIGNKFNFACCLKLPA